MWNLQIDDLHKDKSLKSHHVWQNIYKDMSEIEQMPYDTYTLLVYLRIIGNRTYKDYWDNHYW